MPTSDEQTAAFDRMFDLHRAAIQRYCLRRLPVDEVNDAVAEVFLVAWRRIASIPEDMDLPWLYGIAHHVVQNGLRSRRRRERLQVRVDLEPVDNSPDPEATTLLHIERQRVLDALATLSGSDQEVLKLKEWEGLSHEAIGAVLGISVHAVDMRVNRARARLADAFLKAEQRVAPTMTTQRPAESGGER